MMDNEISSEHEQLILDKLGEHGLERIKLFLPGIMVGSMGGFIRFLSVFKFSPGEIPSVFLTSSGHIELCWEDASGKAIQFEFGPNSAEYYIESTGKEGSVEYSSIQNIL